MGYDDIFMCYFYDLFHTYENVKLNHYHYYYILKKINFIIIKNN